MCPVPWKVLYSLVLLCIERGPPFRFTLLYMHHTHIAQSRILSQTHTAPLVTASSPHPQRRGHSRIVACMPTDSILCYSCLFIIISHTVVSAQSASCLCHQSLSSVQFSFVADPPRSLHHRLDGRLRIRVYHDHCRIAVLATQPPLRAQRLTVTCRAAVLPPYSGPCGKDLLRISSLPRRCSWLAIRVRGRPRRVFSDSYRSKTKSLVEARGLEERRASDFTPLARPAQR
jgi:hypothetical protein